MNLDGFPDIYQQCDFPQTVNSNKEWKPKSMNPRVTQGLASGGVSEVPAVSVESSGQSQPESSALDSCEAVSKLQEKLDELHIERKQVILPNHIRVPESERLNLSFGSFGSSFVLPTNDVKVPEGEKTSISQPEAPQITEENVEEQSSRFVHLFFLIDSHCLWQRDMFSFERVNKARIPLEPENTGSTGTRNSPHPTPNRKWQRKKNLSFSFIYSMRQG